MKFKYLLFIFILGFVFVQDIVSQIDSSKVTDIVWLKDGSKLTGTILKWDLERGMTFKLLTGAEIIIPKKEIHKVIQDIPLVTGVTGSQPVYAFVKPDRIYAFKEKGWYQNTSGFINVSFSGGAGIHHAMGYRFNRMIGVGIGTGIETHDFSDVRNIIPMYAEARGFFLPNKISPYYALKIGYGFALVNKSRWTTAATGGFHISPELGVRFGGGDVSYYLGVEYKLQNATYTYNNFDFGGGNVTDKISYRRIELRTGLLF
ncbi:MAG: hypothetical protein ABIQ02_04285 [Saprospiraceae bacterium]